MYKKLLAILLSLCLLTGCSQLRHVSTNVSLSDGNACYSDDKLVQASAYAKQVILPESLYLQELINHGGAMALLGSEEAGEESLNYARRILDQRLMRKAKRILTESRQDPDKFLPTAAAVLNIHKDAALLQKISLCLYSLRKMVRMSGSWISAILNNQPINIMLYRKG